MATTLVPTVHERIARCNTSIHLDRLVPGADVVVAVDGTEHNATAPGSSMNFPVPSLGGGEIIHAKQDAGAGFTPWSPDVEVEDVILPPIVSPHLPQEVGACSQCVSVHGIVPGSEIELFLFSTGTIVGNGRADRGGEACVGVDLDSLRGDGFNALGARMLVCGQASPESSSPIVSEGALPKPVITGPLFGCQRMVPTSNLQPGARVRYEMDTQDLGSFCSCWHAANVWIGTDLVAGRSVRAIPYRDSDSCKGDGPPSEWEPVVPPDSRIKPVIEPALIEGDRTLRIGNQFANATIVIRIRLDASTPYEEFGPVGTSQEPEFDLNAPLTAGNVVTVVQTLCSVSVESDPVTVLPQPPVILPPVIVAPLNDCATAVQVSNLHQGAFVRIFADGIPIGVAWAGNTHSIAVPANLTAGMKVTATQRVGALTSTHSDPAIPVGFARLDHPRVMAPVALGDRAVWVSHVTPGAHVSIWQGSMLLGQIDATEPVVKVPTSPVGGAVHATISLCGSDSSSGIVEAIASPCGEGGFATAAEAFKQYADFAVPDVVDGTAFTSPIEGQLYFPSDDGKSWPSGGRNLPLVVIAHGYWNPGVNSYLGYDYLARHLARWGMVVYSLNLDEANLRTDWPAPHQYARGEIILHAIDELRGDSAVQGRVDFDRVGLIGHSMGGEGVVAAQHLNDSESRGYGILGVVSIAPTNHRPELVLRRSRYLQILGTMDLLSLSADSVDQFNGFRLNDRAWHPKTHAWIYGARHNPFNRSWVADGDTFESGWADQALPPSTHELIAQCMINAFFQDALSNRTEYAGYMEGTILPQPLRHLQMHLQHRRQPIKVIDNFGDLDEQEGFAAEAIDKTTNRLTLTANAVGTGLVSWEDIDLTVSPATSPHQGQSTELSWNPPVVADVIYTSEAGGAAASSADVVSIRVGQFFEDATVNNVGIATDLFVTLDDGTGRATVRAGSVAPIPYVDPQGAKLCPMRTIRIPIDAFTIANRSFNPSNIVRISLDLTARPTGRIFVDDIEISS
jgi:dienelactone hydrolase